jgi:hypothetical protein
MNINYDLAESKRKEVRRQQEEENRKMAQQYALSGQVSFSTRIYVIFLNIPYNFSANKKDDPGQLHKQVSHSTSPSKMYTYMYILCHLIHTLHQFKVSNQFFLFEAVEFFWNCWTVWHIATQDILVFLNKILSSSSDIWISSNKEYFSVERVSLISNNSSTFDYSLS